jgi:hypothetical protein
MAKNEAAKAKANCNKVHATQVAQQTMHLPRVEEPIPRVEMPIPRVTANIEAHRTQAVTAAQHIDRHKPIVTNPSVQ